MSEEPENLEAKTETVAEAETAQDSAAEQAIEIQAQDDSDSGPSAEAEPSSDSEDARTEAEPRDEQKDIGEAGADGEPQGVDEPARIPNLKGLIGRKVGMTQIFDETGAAIPITVIRAGPCTVTQIRTHAKNGYTAVQLGMEETSQRRLTGGQLGHLKRTNAPPLRHLREFRIRDLGDLKEGEAITVRVFQVGDRVDVVGTSKGRGFAGAIKRHGFHRGPKTHGQSDRERAPGSHGAGSTPGRVFKGVKGPGQMGSVRVSSQNLRVHLVDPERNLLGVRGSVPGPKGGLVTVRERRKQ